MKEKLKVVENLEHLAGLLKKGAQFILDYSVKQKEFMIGQNMKTNKTAKYVKVSDAFHRQRSIPMDKLGNEIWIRSAIKQKRLLYYTPSEMVAA